MNTVNELTKVSWKIALLVGAMLLLGVAAGCSAKSATPTTNPATDNKAMLESVAKWYVAQGQLDVPGYKAGIYDPTNILGVATMTAPPAGAKKTAVNWKWVGDSVVVTVPSESSTVTLSPSGKPGIINITDAGGQSGTFVMKNVSGSWKIDIAATQKQAAADNAARSKASSSTPTTTKP